LAARRIRAFTDSITFVVQTIRQDFGVEAEERGELFPGVFPQFHDR
jgi:hypothetical protein